MHTVKKAIENSHKQNPLQIRSKISKMQRLSNFSMNENDNTRRPCYL